jgi:restriction system protein
VLPLLLSLGDGRERSISDLNEEVSQHFRMSPQDLAEKMTSGQGKFKNRVAWSKLHLKKAGLIEYPSRGITRITSRGQEFLRRNPASLRMKDLFESPEYIEFRERKDSSDADVSNIVEQASSEPDSTPPDEMMDSAYAHLTSTLAGEIVDRIHQVSPEFFEKLVLDVLIAMGYGGSQAEAQEHVGRAGDGGIDGIIREDRLGLDMIYIQAKRWERNIGRPDIQQFVGALQGQRARKGVFITTSNFSREARDYAAALDVRVSLIDGTTLARLMIEHNVGVSVERVYQVKRMDSDYFEEQ